jgi:hypothetical protein
LIASSTMLASSIVCNAVSSRSVARRGRFLRAPQYRSHAFANAA